MFNIKNRNRRKEREGERDRVQRTWLGQQTVGIAQFENENWFH